MYGYIVSYLLMFLTTNISLFFFPIEIYLEVFNTVYLLKTLLNLPAAIITMAGCICPNLPSSVVFYSVTLSSSSRCPVNSPPLESGRAVAALTSRLGRLWRKWLYAVPHIIKSQAASALVSWNSCPMDTLSGEINTGIPAATNREIQANVMCL